MPGDVSLVMPFGKHRGKMIEECPSDYLRWLDENSDDEDVRDAAETEIKYRDDHGEHWYE